MSKGVCMCAWSPPPYATSPPGHPRSDRGLTAIQPYLVHVTIPKAEITIYKCFYPLEAILLVGFRGRSRRAMIAVASWHLANRVNTRTPVTGQNGQQRTSACVTSTISNMHRSYRFALARAIASVTAVGWQKYCSWCQSFVVLAATSVAVYNPRAPS
jgi:hypothetical protein